MMAPLNRFCTFFLDGQLFGVEVAKVQEVIRHQPITRVPLAPPVVGGLINLRGQIVTALEMRKRLKLSDRPADQLPLNIVVQTDEGPLSLLVDDVGEVMAVDEAAFERPPEMVRGVGRELIRGAYKLEGRLLLVLDLDKTVVVSGNRAALKVESVR
jgi:purine-binding chemotaxis protein CheW